MQNLKEVREGRECVWFEIEPSESENFLKWAKNLGCVWINGGEIKPEKGANFSHFLITNDGKLACVPMFAWKRRRYNHLAFKSVQSIKRV